METSYICFSFSFFFFRKKKETLVAPVAPQRVKCEVERCNRTVLQKNWERHYERCHSIKACAGCGNMVYKHASKYHQESICTKRLVRCPGLFCTQKVPAVELDTMKTHPQFLLTDHQCKGVWKCAHKNACDATFLDPSDLLAHVCVRQSLAHMPNKP